MKYIYCKINMGTLYQDIMLVDTSEPSLHKLGSCRVENLGEERVFHCYQEHEYNVKLEGNPDFYKAVIGNVTTYDTEHQIKFIN